MACLSAAAAELFMDKGSSAAGGVHIPGTQGTWLRVQEMENRGRRYFEDEQGLLSEMIVLKKLVLNVYLLLIQTAYLVYPDYQHFEEVTTKNILIGGTLWRSSD